MVSERDIQDSGNYLRVRGEYDSQAKSCVSFWELPPRARRILGQVTGDRGWQGTTSACAENTQVMPVAQIEKWNYLRVRGEYHLTSRQVRLS